MKRLPPLILAVCLLLTTTVSADLITITPNDSFYAAHIDDCRYEPHEYVTNGTEGY